MHFSFNKLIIILLFGLTISSCKKDPEVDEIIKGCKDPLADNYNSKVEVDNGSCTYQKRFIAKYDIDVLCGAASAIFKDASMEIKENSKKNRVNFNIGSVAGNFIFDGIITKETVTIDTIIKNLVVNAKTINVAFDSIDVKADIALKSVLNLSENSKTLTGNMNVVITTAEAFIYKGIPIPVGTSIKDDCSFTGNKK